MGERWTMDSVLFCQVWAKNLKANGGVGNWSKFIHELWKTFYPLNDGYKFQTEQGKGKTKTYVPLSNSAGTGEFNPEDKNDRYYFLSEKSYMKCQNIIRSIKKDNDKHKTDHHVPILPDGYLSRGGKKKSSRPSSKQLSDIFV